MSDNAKKQTTEQNVELQVLRGIDEIDAIQWDSLVEDNYPFLKTAFLGALEKYHCVGEDVGWIPRHLCYFNDDKLQAALPLYEKHNSWGEFVFDHAWADAYQRYGMSYYPKLINAIPFTPATGQRMLVNARAAESPATLVQTLIAGANTLAKQGDYSGLHCLFPNQSDYKQMNLAGALSRNDCQFHWHNQDYQNFDAFLATLKSRKRKKIRQERRRVQDSGAIIEWLSGFQATQRDWSDFTDLYQQIYDRKYGMPAFNRDFFMGVANQLPGQVHLLLARQDGKAIAGALMYSDDTTLYGRHWGCNAYLDCLHFELCYYQGIEYCIRQGLKKFDPGAQGEHKVARGFLPTRTQSLHWLADSPFKNAIADFVMREQHGVSNYINAVQSHSPYNR